jgi:hypothetical protein
MTPLGGTLVVVVILMFVSTTIHSCFQAGTHVATMVFVVVVVMTVLVLTVRVGVGAVTVMVVVAFPEYAVTGAGVLGWSASCVQQTLSNLHCVCRRGIRCANFSCCWSRKGDG